MISVVIPACNEENVIERCLGTILQDAAPGELEVVVVCNGCSDETAERARGFGDRVRVIETEIASKIQALNLGDEAATGFPRFYVDADIKVTTQAIRDVASLLGDDPSIMAAAPRAEVDYQTRGALVRSFYQVWTSLPYFREAMIGAGVFALSRQGKERLGRFPDIIADDEYARLMFKPDERQCCGHSTFVITPPATLRGVLNIKTRARAGMYELRQKYPDLMRNQNTNAARSLRTIATTPRLWIHSPVYLTVMTLAKVLAHRKLRRNEERYWNRDDTSRATS